jgi:hypothetical protein
VRSSEDILSRTRDSGTKKEQNQKMLMGTIVEIRTEENIWTN